MIVQVTGFSKQYLEKISRKKPNSSPLPAFVIVFASRFRAAARIKGEWGERFF